MNAPAEVITTLPAAPSGGGLVAAIAAGSPIRMTEARVRSTIPLASINPHRPDNSRQ
jgi:hypothetical protein